MRPSALSLILGDQWSTRARNRFITLVKSRALVVSLFSILHGVMRVDLLISTDTDPVNVSVLDVMVKEGHALKAEECFESKVASPFSELLVGRGLLGYCNRTH